MSTYIVKERSDGRGGIKPFNSYNKRQSGASVMVGNKKLKVTSDGRVNIPKSIMQQYGIKGDDGRLRIAMTFATDGGKNGWKDVGGIVVNPPERAKNLGNGDILTNPPAKNTRLAPSDGPDYSWSPV